MRIESVSNNLIKQAYALHQKKYRDEFDLFLAQGFRFVADAILGYFDLIEYVFITDDGRVELDRFINNNADRFANLSVNRLENKMVYVTKAIINKLSISDNPQEIIAVIRKKPQSNPTNYVLFLDRVRDPGNLGSILRTASASGYSLILDNCADIYSPKVVQSSMSAILSVPFMFGSISTLTDLKSSGYKIVSADLYGENLFKTAILPPVCAVIGNEANGICNEIIDISDQIITIPMEKTESLNASVSAGIVMYHIKNSQN